MAEFVLGKFLYLDLFLIFRSSSSDPLGRALQEGQENWEQKTQIQVQNSVAQWEAVENLQTLFSTLQ